LSLLVLPLRCLIEHSWAYIVTIDQYLLHHPFTNLRVLSRDPASPLTLVRKPTSAAPSGCS